MQDKLEMAKSVIKENIRFALCGIFDTRNVVGDPMHTVFNQDDLKIDICYGWDYFEVFGLSQDDFNELEEYYYRLRREVRSNG